MTTASLDMNPIISGLIEARHAADDLEGLELQIDKANGTRRVEMAEATRSLLALADRLDLLAGLVRQEYWLLKGQQRAVGRSFTDTLDPNLKAYL